MPELVEGKHPGEHIVHEESKDLSREKIILATGNLLAGAVLGRITAGSECVELAPAAADGSEVAMGILWANTDATVAAVSAVAHTALTKVRDENLTWPVGITGPQKTAAIAELKALNIIVQL